MSGDLARTLESNVDELEVRRNGILEIGRSQCGGH